MSIIHKPHEPNLDLRHILSLIAIGLCLLAVFLRLWVLQVVYHDEFVEKAQQYRTSSFTRLAPRGLVYDRTEKVLLAGVKPRIIVTAKPKIVLAEKNRWVLKKLARILETDENKLVRECREGIWKPLLPTPIFLGATVSQATRIAEEGDALPGIGVETQATRYYPDSKSYAHVLSYVWTPDSQDVKRLKEMGLEVPDYVGKNGLEYVYEDRLMGKPGIERVEVNAQRKPIRVLERVNPVPGDRLVLSIDDRLQKLAHSLLKGKEGAIVMTDPSNGEVLCLYSSPSYDVRLFEGGISAKNYKRLSEDPRHPQTNRATGGLYSPGSTFKLVTAMAAERSGMSALNRHLYCPGYLKVGNRIVKCQNHPHATMSFRSALQKSCNTFFGSLADQIGPDILCETALMVGLGSKSGIDLRTESKGVVPTKEWVLARRDPPKWYRGDTVNIGIGQGDLLVSPLQMCQLASLVANEGVSYRPHLVKAIIGSGPDGKRTEVVRTVAHEIQLSQAFWNEIKAAMISVIEGGTGGRARIPGVTWAAKTGSTEHRKGKKTHGWFMGFAPAYQPKVAISVLVESAGHGGQVSAPIAKQLVQTYLEILRNESAAASKDSSALPASATPDRSAINR